ncbi:hypothetical protein [Niastella sp. OAS944]|uniref:hypothetical protein n=1 Tax=Niastella sp. OAS944 TaxID=2664089 RepID=UPI003475F29E|nr:hypothetical protein [Chitinophagaceae bacterium OAS944]
MFTIENYFDGIRHIDFSKYPEAIQKGHEFVLKITSNGANWDNYHASNAIKKTVDIYLSKLNAFVNGNTTGKQEKKRKIAAPQKHIPKEKEPEQPGTPINLVERIPEELRFIKRFVNLDGKTKTKEELLRFINSLQKAILEKRIRKTSTWAEQIVYIQESLIQVYNTMKQKIKIELKPETRDKFRQLAGDEKVLPSIGFIKRYIGLNGKTGIKEKARKLLDQINKTMDKGKITDYDRYISEIHTIKKNLKAFISHKAEKTLEIEKAELNGLQGILGCNCQQLNGNE